MQLQCSEFAISNYISCVDSVSARVKAEKCWPIRWMGVCVCVCVLYMVWALRTGDELNISISIFHWKMGSFDEFSFING